MRSQGVSRETVRKRKGFAERLLVERREVRGRGRGSEVDPTI